jgi:putative chitinase
MFNRDVFFDKVRNSPFNGLNQSQVDGMNGILDAWEANPRSEDLRWLAYPLATAAHETGMEMQPIEEYGKGEGMEYGEPVSETGHAYYGRGFVQLTWDDNYKKADKELGFGTTEDSDSCYWHPERQLEAKTAAETMFQGMVEGWFRTHDDGGRETLERYFNAGTNDPYGAREIINGDKSKVPSWSNGVSIGNLIKGYHHDFLAALEAAAAAFMPPPVFIEPGDPDAPEHMPPEEGTWDEYIIRVPFGTPVEIVKLTRRRQGGTP